MKNESRFLSSTPYRRPSFYTPCKCFYDPANSNDRPLFREMLFIQACRLREWPTLYAEIIKSKANLEFVERLRGPISSVAKNTAEEQKERGTPKM